MSKKESTFLNMIITLFVITMVAGISLGYVNDITVGPKAEAKLARKVIALKQVMAEFDNNPVEEVIMIKSELVKDSVEIYTGSLNGVKSGTAVVGSSEKGYSGLIKLMVGFESDGSIRNIVVLEQKETPGLGTKMKDDKFLRQFRGKNPSTFDLKPKKDGGDVDALTGSTITTRAFGEAAQLAFDEYMKNNDSKEESKN